MNLLLRFALIVSATLITKTSCLAHGRSTLILIRHAEKAAKSADPALTEAGIKRAESLQEVFKDYHPDLFYSTDTKRTKQTLAAWSKAAGKDIIIYDPTKQEEFAKQLLSMQDKTIVIVGHSNTIPQLANLLTGTTSYADMADKAYNKAYIITVEHGHAEAVEKEYGPDK